MLPPPSSTAFGYPIFGFQLAKNTAHDVSTHISSMQYPVAQTRLLCKLIAIKYDQHGLQTHDDQLARQNQLWTEIDTIPDCPTRADLLVFIENDRLVIPRKIPLEFQKLLKNLANFEKQNIINSFDDVDRENMCNFLAEATDEGWGNLVENSGISRNPSVDYPLAYNSKRLLQKNDFFSPKELNQLNDAKRFFILNKHAADGHPVAQNLIGEFYYFINKNLMEDHMDLALQFFTQSAKSGNNEAKDNLLQAYVKNIELLKNADATTRSFVTQLLIDGAQKYGVSELGNQYRTVLCGELLAETGEARAVKLLDEMMNAPILAP